MKIETIIGSIFIVATILKYLQIPGSNMIFVIAMIHFAVIYFFLAFYLFCNKEIQNQNLILSIASGILLSIGIIGIMFGIMHWDGAFFYLVSGLIGAILIYGIAYFLKTKAPENLNNYYRNMLLRSGILILLQIVCLLYINLN